MSDRRLRELSRLAAQGDPEAAEQLLRERHRAGTVPGERLRALALLGEPVARRVLGGEWPAALADPVELVARLRPAAHRALVVRALLRVGEQAAGRWEEAVGDGRAREALEAARAWLAAVDAGAGEADAAVTARGLAGELRAAALQRFDPAGEAGRAVGGLAAVIDATGGAFLAHAEAFLDRALAAGLEPGAVCAAILAVARADLLEDLE